jgi:hypothetical protein
MVLAHQPSQVSGDLLDVKGHTHRETIRAGARRHLRHEPREHGMQETGKLSTTRGSNAMLERTTFTTSRAMEFVTEKELQMQIGHDRDLWPIALAKELIDNGLDACEDVPANRAEASAWIDALLAQRNGGAR